MVASSAWSKPSPRSLGTLPPRLLALRRSRRHFCYTDESLGDWRRAHGDDGDRAPDPRRVSIAITLRCEPGRPPGGGPRTRGHVLRHVGPWYDRASFAKLLKNRYGLVVQPGYHHG